MNILGTIVKNTAAYLKDWRNLLTHALIGAGILLLAIFVPVHPAYRIAGLVLVIGFNVVRMRRKARREADRKQPVTAE